MSRTEAGGARVLAAALGAVAATAAVAASSASASIATCQPFLDDEPCLQPFPNNLFTKKANTPTGRRVDLPANAMPVAETGGGPINPAEWNRNDGFSPGSMITVKVPGLDTPEGLANTKPAPLADLKKHKRPGAPVAVIDQKTGKRHPIWVELDSNADSAENTNLLIHPAVNFKLRHRYVVVLRDLEDANGDRIEAPRWFELLREGGGLPKELKNQRKRYKGIFHALEDARIERNRSLYLAWNFTVASRRGLTSRLLEIRDDAFAQLGDTDLDDLEVEGSAPPFEVTEVESFTPAENPQLLRIVRGNYTVPCYLTEPGCPPGAGFNYDSGKRDALPTQIPGNVAEPEFVCVVPRVAAQQGPARASLYGHGLLGSPDEVDAGNIQDMASEHNFVFCATATWGMSEEDIPYDVEALGDLNKFPPVVDRLQQGALNTQFLGRLMIHPDGLGTDPAFRANGSSLIDSSHLYYDGNSQGGISGGMNTAIAPDFTQAVLGVPGMNYGGLLLQRSSDFPAYATFLYEAYPDTSTHPVLLSVMSQLWDRGEGNGYAANMTSDPPPNTPPHNVLMHVAYGDFQVSHYAATVEARTIGARSYRPAVDLPAREQDQNIFWKIKPIEGFPYDGSAIVIWDSGLGYNTPPPLTNTDPEEPANGEDPHGEPRSTVAAREQKAAFLSPNGSVIDVCGGQPCHTDDFRPEVATPRRRPAGRSGHPRPRRAARARCSPRRAAGCRRRARRR